jgi:hypothetical protein
MASPHPPSPPVAISWLVRGLLVYFQRVPLAEAGFAVTPVLEVGEFPSYTPKQLS